MNYDDDRRDTQGEIAHDRTEAVKREWELTVITPSSCKVGGPEVTRWGEFATAEAAVSRAKKHLATPYGIGSFYCITVVAAVVRNAATFEVAYRGYRKSIRVKDNGLYAKLFLFGGESDPRKWQTVDDEKGDCL